jgi:hypothetical protein
MWCDVEASDFPQSRRFHLPNFALPLIDCFDLHSTM